MNDIKQQPEALRLAEVLETHFPGSAAHRAADELRRLHAENALLHYTLTAYVGVSEALAVEQKENERLESQRDELLDALKEASKALATALPHMQTDEYGNGPDCTQILQAQINISYAIAKVEGEKK